jgi:hypothetical protein
MAVSTAATGRTAETGTTVWTAGDSGSSSLGEAGSPRVEPPKRRLGGEKSEAAETTAPGAVKARGWTGVPADGTAALWTTLAQEDEGPQSRARDSNTARIRLMRLPSPRIYKMSIFAEEPLGPMSPRRRTYPDFVLS